MPFQIHVTELADGLRLSLTGELDLAAAPILEDRLARLRATRSPVRLDLSELEFIDSSGIHLLIQTVAEGRTKRWPVQIDPVVGPQVMRLFRLARLEHFAGWNCG
jgi:anti-anti-sigma factor